jgi:hypothetical protein
MVFRRVCLLNCNNAFQSRGRRKGDPGRRHQGSDERGMMKSGLGRSPNSAKRTTEAWRQDGRASDTDGTVVVAWRPGHRSKGERIHNLLSRPSGCRGRHGRSAQRAFRFLGQPRRWLDWLHRRGCCGARNAAGRVGRYVDGPRLGCCRCRQRASAAEDHGCDSIVCACQMSRMRFGRAACRIEKGCDKVVGPRFLAEPVRAGQRQAASIGSSR